VFGLARGRGSYPVNSRKEGRDEMTFIAEGGWGDFAKIAYLSRGGVQDDVTLTIPPHGTFEKGGSIVLIQGTKRHWMVT